MQRARRVQRAAPAGVVGAHVKIRARAAERSGATRAVFLGASGSDGRTALAMERLSARKGSVSTSALASCCHISGRWIHTRAVFAERAHLRLRNDADDDRRRRRAVDEHDHRRPVAAVAWPRAADDEARAPASARVRVVVVVVRVRRGDDDHWVRRRMVVVAVGRRVRRHHDDRRVRRRVMVVVRVRRRVRHRVGMRVVRRHGPCVLRLGCKCSGLGCKCSDKRRQINRRFVCSLAGTCRGRWRCIELACFADGFAGVTTLAMRAAESSDCCALHFSHLSRERK